MRARPGHRWVLILLIPLLSLGCSRVFYPVSCEKVSRPSLKKLAVLSPEIRETSGLAVTDGILWTINDSGGEAALYGVDVSGCILHKTVLLNSYNADWEDLAEDDSCLYVADVGNNFARRDTLQILMVRKEHLLSAAGIQPSATILFSFAGPVTTTPAGWSSHDCEALVAWGDSLYLFTKNWTDFSTSVYSLPKAPGYYELSPLQTLQVGALITGADILPSDRLVALVGYRNYHPVLLTYRFASDPSQINCSTTLWHYPLRTGRQVEGICYDGDGNLYISSEGSFFKPALFRVGK